MRGPLALPGVAQQSHGRIVATKLPVPGLLDVVALRHRGRNSRMSQQRPREPPNQFGVRVQPAQHPGHPIIVGDFIAQRPIHLALQREKRTRARFELAVERIVTAHPVVQQAEVPAVGTARVTIPGSQQSNCLPGPWNRYEPAVGC